MAGGEGGAPPPEAGPSSQRCPSCGGLLTFEPGRPGGYCAIEAIFVEVVPAPPSGADRPLLVRDAVLRATKKQLHDLCHAYGLRVSGNKTDLLTRILRYMDENRIDLPPEERGQVAAPAEVLEVIPEEASAETSPEVLPPTSAPEAATESAVTAVSAEVDHLLQEIDHAATAPVELVPEEEPERARPWSEPSITPTRRAADAARLRRDRRTFYAGTLLTTAGGIGLVLGSLLHDLLRVPLVGTSYGAFGPLNATAAIAGGVVLLIGLAAIKRSLRGGVVRADSVAV